MSTKKDGENVDSPVKLEEKEGTLTAYIDCEIDHHTAKIIREKIDSSLFLYKLHSLVLDFGAVGFMDSSGIGLILGRLSKCKELSIRLRIVNLSRALYKIVSLSGIERQSGIEIRQVEKR